jgi:DNA-binding MarR family transcriptional regulator
MQHLEVFGIDIGKGKFQEIAIYVLARIYSLLEREISNYLRPFGLTPAKFNAMMVIKHKGKDKGISQIEIGRQLIVTASNMTRLLDRLSKEGFIERLAEGGDRRVNLIKISQKGSSVLDQVWPGYYKKINALAQLLETKDL